MMLLWIALSVAAPTAEQRTIGALSARHMVESCEELERDLHDPIATWLAATDVVSPPWVATRAADCLLRHDDAHVNTVVLTWMRTPEKAGLAELALRRAPSLQPERADAWATAALRGPLAERLGAVLPSSKAPARRQRAVPKQ